MSADDELVRRFRRVISDSVLIDLLETVYSAYPTAWQTASDFHLATARNHYPAERLALVADGLRGLVDRHPEMSGDDRRTSSGGYTYFELSCGPVVMTAHAVEAHNTPPRHAEFRQSLSECNLELFEASARTGSNNPLCGEDGQIYAEIIHAPHPKDFGVPAFINIGFPDPSARRFLCHLELFRMFPDVYARLRGVALEEVVEARMVLRRRPARRVQDGDKSS